MDVDRNQNWIGNLALVVVEGDDSASHRHHDTVNFAIVVSVIKSSGAAHDVHDILVPAQQPILPEVRDLFARVACDVVRKNRFQRPPFLSIFLPWGELLCDKSRICIEKRDR